MWITPVYIASNAWQTVKLSTLWNGCDGDNFSIMGIIANIARFADIVQIMNIKVIHNYLEVIHIKDEVIHN